MYDIKWIREHPDAFDRGLKRRGLAALSNKLIKLDESRRSLIARLEQAQARRNAASNDIGQAKAEYEQLKVENAQLAAEFSGVYDTPRTLATVLKWSGLSLALVGIIGWYAVSQAR